MATWPSSLPQRPLQSGFGASLGSGRVSSQPEHGPRQYRRRFTTTEDPINATFRLTFDQWHDLKVFYRVTLSDGSLRFDFPSPLDGSLMVVSFAEPPKIQSVVGADHVDVAVKVLEQAF